MYKNHQEKTHSKKVRYSVAPRKNTIRIVACRYKRISYEKEQRNYSAKSKSTIHTNREPRGANAKRRFDFSLITIGGVATLTPLH